MKFYSSSDKAGIVDDVFFLLFGESSDHSADYPLADIARNVNRWYDAVVVAILKSDNRWEWDDSNKTDLPIANISLVANQQDYGVSGATYLKIKKIDIKDSAGNNVPLTPFNLDDVPNTADADILSTAGTPKFFRLRGNSVFLYPKPNYSYTNGMRVFYQRNVDYFTSADTTKVPGFAEMFHRILSLGAARDYAAVNGMKDKVAMCDTDLYGDARKEKLGLFAELENFYANRENTSPRMKLGKTDYGEIGLQSGVGRNAGNPNGFTLP